MTQPQRQSGTFAADFEALQASMRGQALSPTAPDYDTTRKVFSGHSVAAAENSALSLHLNSVSMRLAP